jgi:hypothetical protein
MYPADLLYSGLRDAPDQDLTGGVFGHLPLQCKTPLSAVQAASFLELSSFSMPCGIGTTLAFNRGETVTRNNWKGGRNETL